MRSKVRVCVDGWPDRAACQPEGHLRAPRTMHEATKSAACIRARTPATRRAKTPPPTRSQPRACPAPPPDFDGSDRAACQQRATLEPPMRKRRNSAACGRSFAFTSMAGPTEWRAGPRATRTTAKQSFNPLGVSTPAQQGTRRGRTSIAGPASSDQANLSACHQEGRHLSACRIPDASRIPLLNKGTRDDPGAATRQLRASAQQGAHGRTAGMPSGEVAHSAVVLS